MHLTQAILNIQAIIPGKRKINKDDGAQELMKPISWIIILTITFFTYSCSESDKGKGSTKNKRDSSIVTYKAQFSYMMYKAIKTNDFKAYSTSFITASDLDYFFLMKLASKQKKIRKPEQLKKLKQEIITARKNFPARRKARLATLKNSFIRLRNKARQKGVDWKTAKFTGYKLKNARHIHKIATADFLITFTSNNKHYVFKVPRAQFVRRGWIYSEPLRWVGIYK